MAGLHFGSRGGASQWPFLVNHLFQEGQAGVWYDPSDLSTLFQDSAGTTPVTEPGQPVGLMLDKSGNGYHASQSVAAARPIYDVTEEGKRELRYLSFDGVDDFLLAVGAANAVFRDTPAVGYSTSVAFRFFNLVNQSSGWRNAAAYSDSGVGYMNAFAAESPERAGVYHWDSAAKISVVEAPILGNNIVLSARKDATTINGRVNGVAGPIVAATAVNSSMGNDLRIGRGSGAGSIHTNGRLFGMVAVDRLITVGAHKALETWLEAKLPGTELPQTVTADSVFFTADSTLLTVDMT